MIDISFQMDADTPDDFDADTYSPTLRDYHLLLWNKRLANGKMFELSGTRSAPYHLCYYTEQVNLRLSSDNIIHTYSKIKNKKMSAIINSIPQSDIDVFYRLGNTIGGYVVFPAKQINRKQTINQMRGTHQQIRDRFDLTLECIRRWYSGIESPLFECLDRYCDFFQLFGDFRGYIKFFLLDEIIDKNTGFIRFWLPFSEFGETEPLPGNTNEYKNYMKNVMDFTRRRNLRIAKWVSDNKH